MMNEFTDGPSVAALEAGVRAERAVLDALAVLPAPWQYFHAVEWRTLRPQGEAVGEADVIVFHPQHGVVIFEIKSGGVNVRDGAWFYSSGLKMNQSPFSQARRNRYALVEKLKARLNKDAAEALAVTHAVWFPDVVWQGSVVGTEAPSRSFIFDRLSLANPEAHLKRMFREAVPDAIAWTKSQTQVLKELLAPDCHQVVPVATHIAHAAEVMQRATEQQINVLRILRLQKRLLVEGLAGSGKTLLAMMLAKEHAALGKRVLLTCFNKFLAKKIQESLQGLANIEVCHFHELVKAKAEEAGLPYNVPADLVERGQFFREDCAEILLTATDSGIAKFDTIIVDEGADFAPTWWVAMESLGSEGFSWYCFYDTKQSIYSHGEAWHPPFEGIPFVLDENLRNTRPIGEFASKVGQCAAPSLYRVESGLKPRVRLSGDFAEMGLQLKEELRDLIRKQSITPEQIVVLSPYRHTNQTSTWTSGLADVEVETDMVSARQGAVRVGTIQGFKGLEADVIVLVGIDERAGKHPEWLYVGATRARAMLIMLMLDSAGDVG